MSQTFSEENMSIESNAIRNDPLFDKILGMVLWGESEEKVFATLKANGIAGVRADRLYREARQERNNTIRSSYTKKAALGGLMIAGALGLFCGFWYGLGFMFRPIIAISAVLGLFGAHKLIDGMIGCAFAHKKEGSITEEI